MQTTQIKPTDVDSILKRHILKDGMNMVMDLKQSQGAWVYDSKNGRKLLDLFTCFATVPVGYNHPKMVNDASFKENLLEAALVNPSNSDIYTTQYAAFMETFERVGIPPYLKYAFFIAGGALGVENCLKAAMDWKVQKNFHKGHTREKGFKILGFREAFHGRSGYTMTLTNTDPNKTKWFARFPDWPLVLNPKIKFPYSDANHEDLLQREALSLRQIKQAFLDSPDEIAAIIIEPIQGEGGDNHFRPEFMKALRQVADENEALLIFDEVQMGVACTGKFWAHQHFGPEAQPDLISFGKKMQVCGCLAGPKLDEVEGNVFRTSSRINSTWGGNLVDMVRADKILQIIEEEALVNRAATVGQHLQDKLHGLAQQHPEVISNVRGRGLICAFDLPGTAYRNAFVDKGEDMGVLFLGAAARTIRFRPTLTITESEIDFGMEVIDKVVRALGHSAQA